MSERAFTVCPRHCSIPVNGRSCRDERRTDAPADNMHLVHTGVGRMYSLPSNHSTNPTIIETRVLYAVVSVASVDSLGGRSCPDRRSPVDGEDKGRACHSGPQGLVRLKRDWLDRRLLESLRSRSREERQERYWHHDSNCRS